MGTGSLAQAKMVYRLLVALALVQSCTCIPVSPISMLELPGQSSEQEVRTEAGLRSISTKSAVVAKQAGELEDQLKTEIEVTTEKTNQLTKAVEHAKQDRDKAKTDVSVAIAEKRAEAAQAATEGAAKIAKARSDGETKKKKAEIEAAAEKEATAV